MGFRAHHDEAVVFKGEKPDDIRVALEAFDRMAVEIRQRIGVGEEVCLNTQTGFTMFESVGEPPTGGKLFVFVRTYNDVIAFVFPQERVEMPSDAEGELPS